MILHDYQEQARDDAKEFLLTSPRGSSRAYSSPTGSGKSYIEGSLIEVLPQHIQIVPSIEIAQGILSKIRGVEIDGDFEVTESARIFTVKRAYNLLAGGRFPFLPSSVSFDESHHSTDDTHVSVWEMLGRPARVGYTATAYRGTPQETKKFYDAWGRNITPILTLKGAVERGVISVPSWDVWPLINDDMIEVRNGEFVVSKIDGAIHQKLPDLISRVGQFFNGSRYDRPTMITVSSVAAVKMVVEEMRNQGLPAVGVTADTGRTDRRAAFAETLDCRVILVNVSVVGEGVDLPLRRLIDLSPTMSPVRFMQRVGRITRPTDRSPEYITCCHNLARHAYLWEGLVPPVALKLTRSAWGEQWKPNRRQLTRAIGIEGFGKFMPNEVPLLDGSWGTLYAFQVKDGTHQYGVFLHPAKPNPSYFHRANSVARQISEDQWERDWGKWEIIDSLPDVVGCISVKPSVLQPKQKRWWTAAAMRYDLDPNVEVTNRVFQILPILRDVERTVEEL